MRSFVNGTFLTDKTGKLPIRNTMRVPLFNNPVPHALRTLNPERLYRKLTLGFTSINHALALLTISFTVLGDPRSNQNPALLVFGILWFRWHNVVAKRVQEQHPDWPDEEVFQKARRFVIATLQVLYSSMKRLRFRNVLFNALFSHYRI